MFAVNKIKNALLRGSWGGKKGLVMLLCIAIALLAGCIAAPADSAPDLSPLDAVSPQSTPDINIYSDDEMTPEDSQGPEGSLDSDDGIIVGGVYRVAVKEYLSLRASDDTGAFRMEKLQNGELVRVLQSDGDFVRVQTQSGARGFVMSEYLVLAEDSDWTSPPDDEPGAYSVICRSYLSFRDGPRVDAERIDKLEPLSQVLLIETFGEYAKVKFGEKIGYVLISYLNKGEFAQAEDAAGASSAEETDAQKGNASVWIAACEEYLSLRNKPSISADRIAKIPAGAQVEIEDFIEAFALVRYEGKQGYVLSGYLTQRGVQDYERDLDIVMPSAAYSYEQMMKDLGALEKRYSGKLVIGSIGKSENGRDIPVAVIGDKDAEKRVLIQAAIHGREHMTACLAMGLIEHLLRNSDEPFADGTLGEAASGVRFDIVPMVNPDGVAISLSGKAGEAVSKIYESDIAAGRAEEGLNEYLSAWKANANGVDLNRNFAAGWKDLSGPNTPSFERYKGKKPENQSESSALAEYARENNFDATISYHAYGSVIFWAYGDNGAVNAASRDLGRAIRNVTKYPLNDGETLDAGGFKDWAIDELGVPSLTIEIGTRDCPLPVEEFATIWARNKDVLGAAARWVKNR